MLKIINATDIKALAKECLSLYDLVLQSGFKIDVAVGIATGGAVCAEQINFGDDVKLFTLKRQRSSTIKKVNNSFFKILPYLPLSVLNLLRIVEVLHAEFIFEKIKKRKLTEAPVADITQDAKLSNLFEGFTGNVLIIDDAIDSGGTIKDVLNYCKKILPNATIKTAVINQTFNSPVIEVDYVLYKRTIIRCPWAFDVKKFKGSKI